MLFFSNILNEINFASFSIRFFYNFRAIKEGWKKNAILRKRTALFMALFLGSLISAMGYLVLVFIF